jgi:ferredoxin-NADP reductase
VFSTPQTLVFDAGQYLEWTLGVPRPDNRGNRRYFTVASSPTEDNVRLGVKFYPKASAFKQQLAAMKTGDTIIASQVAGQFTLPTNPRTKLVFLAGGVGITPFRSMLQYLVDRDEPRPVVVLYGVDSQDDIAYGDVIDAAWENLHIPTYFAVDDGALPGQYPGFINEQMVRETIPDYRERMFYISGPQAMVRALRRMLVGMGVRRSRIKVDFFPGFA